MFARFSSALLAGLALAGHVCAQPAPPVSPSAPPAFAPNDYGDKASWLCWPGRADACHTDLTTTIVAADGGATIEPFTADPNAPIDCFYVYPTVSKDPGAVSTMAVEAEERSVVAQQFARFGAKCRLYAPMYRQFTLTALTAMMSGQPLPGSGPDARRVGYNDVRDAWIYYLAHENHGRGVVLIGHSQGSGVLTQLIKNEVDGKPEQRQLVSALLLGTALVVPAGADVGGDFKSIPLCHAADQSGCVLAYSSFRETSPPPENSRFGRPRTPQPGMVAACVNPASLGGGPGALHSYFGAQPIAGPSPTAHVWDKARPITTPFVSVPGMLTATCVSTPAFNYLSIHINGDPAGPRGGDIPGDVVVPGVGILKDWGLHLIDANLAMGNLVDLVGQEGAAWRAKNGG